MAKEKKAPISKKQIVKGTIEAISEDYKKDFPIVGIGASAGGIKAVEDFFSSFPDTCGMAFVLIMHLSPDHKSSLAEIIQHKTPMETTQVMEEVNIQPDKSSHLIKFCRLKTGF